VTAALFIVSLGLTEISPAPVMASCRNFRSVQQNQKNFLVPYLYIIKTLVGITEWVATHFKGHFPISQKLILSPL